MAECNEISLMLGAFEDGELEPNEMQEVAFHMARCEACTDELSEFSTIGRELRSAVPQIQLDGFAAAVKSRIDAIPQPFSRRLARFFGRGTDFIGSGFAWSGAVAAVATLTAVLITPYAEKLAHREVPTAVARLERDAASLADATAPVTDSHAVISRLESDIPSVAVWSEPRSETTVIWLPDQP